MKFTFKHLLVCIIALLFTIGSAYAENDEEMEMLLLFYKPESLVVSATRSEKPISQAAENISVITSRDIERIHAHTLLDVLVHVTGVQVDLKGGPGVPGNVAIQGSESRHVLVLIDDVPINNLSDNFPDVAAIPVQDIERVEIIKGPASSAWGSSLGGVINVITKGPTDVQGGMNYASVGKENTSSVGAEISGREGRLGHYVHAGTFSTSRTGTCMQSSTTI
jgi:vitamin B12 transporter